MNFLIVGAGYTGLSVLKSLPEGSAAYISRSKKNTLSSIYHIIDLDSCASNSIQISSPYALLYTVPPDPNKQKDDRLTHLLEIISPKPDRIVYLSSTGVYGDQEGCLVSENQLPKPETNRAKKRLQAEIYLENWCNKYKIKLVILRVSGIYGPNRLGLEKLEKEYSIINEDEAKPSNRIHIRDLTNCCIAALTEKNASGIYNISDGDFRSNSWFVKTICKLKGINQPREISHEEALKTWNKSRVSFLTESRRLDTKKLNKELKVKLLYKNPLEGIKASLINQNKDN